jgi:hypothetical protein
MELAMKSLVLLTFLSLSPGEPMSTGKVEFFDDKTTCETRMSEIRTQYGAPARARCSCSKIVPPVSAEGNDAI